MSTQRVWHNYATGEDEIRYAPVTDEDARNLIPQSVACQGLYTVYRKAGLDIGDAMINVLSKKVGEDAPVPLPESASVD